MNSLHRKTLNLLRKDKRSTATIASESGLPYYWLVSFRNERTVNPSVNRVQALYEYLTSKRLAVR